MGLFNNRKNGITVTNINNKMYRYKSVMESIFSKKESKDLMKKNFVSKNVVYYLDFKGDVMASSVKTLREEITAILLSSVEGDEVIISIESAGGTVTGYGLVAEQLDRLKKHGLKVTAIVDQVAASGGYMVACVADEIVVAKRAVLGSIGVVVGMPNYEELLNKIGVSYSFHTAGIKKRGVTPYQTPTEAQVKDLNEQLESIHKQFKDHITEYRPNLDMDKFGTGETWSGLESVELGLADRIGISDDEIMDRIKSNKLVLKVKYVEKKDKGSFFSRTLTNVSESIIDMVISKVENSIHLKSIKKF